eukprot:Sdes_comp17202_c0_seq3m6382
MDFFTSLITWLLPLAHVRLYPEFLFIHCINTSLYTRKTDSDALTFHRKYPLAGLSLNLVHCYGSLLVLDFLTGSKMSLFDEPLLLFSSLLAWYLVFFSPADITMKFCSLLPIKVLIFSILYHDYPRWPLEIFISKQDFSHNGVGTSPRPSHDFRN